MSPNMTSKKTSSKASNTTSNEASSNATSKTPNNTSDKTPSKVSTKASSKPSDKTSTKASSNTSSSASASPKAKGTKRKGPNDLASTPQPPAKRAKVIASNEPLNAKATKRKERVEPTTSLEPPFKKTKVNPPTKSSNTARPVQANCPFSDAFFENMATVIVHGFPIIDFAIRHQCSFDDVADALSAVVMQPLCSPGETGLSASERARILIADWREDQAQAVVKTSILRSPPATPPEPKDEDEDLEPVANDRVELPPRRINGRSVPKGFQIYGEPESSDPMPVSQLDAMTDAEFEQAVSRGLFRELFQEDDERNQVACTRPGTIRTRPKR